MYQAAGWFLMMFAIPYLFYVCETGILSLIGLLISKKAVRAKQILLIISCVENGTALFFDFVMSIYAKDFNSILLLIIWGGAFIRVSILIGQIINYVICKKKKIAGFC